MARLGFENFGLLRVWKALASHHPSSALSHLVKSQRSLLVAIAHSAKELKCREVNIEATFTRLTRPSIRGLSGPTHESL